MSDILSFWALRDHEPRATQIQILEWLANQTAKYLLVQAPVGTGKSAVAMTYSAWLDREKGGNSYILTPQRILQHQYEQTFDANLVSLYGKSNYECKTYNTNCEAGSVICRGSCQKCPWAAKKNAALQSPNVVLNYRLGLLHFDRADFFKKKKLIVCDEAHNLEQQLVDFDCPVIKREMAYSFKVGWLDKPKDMQEAVDWMTEQFLPAMKQRIDILEPEVTEIKERGGKISPREANKIQDFLRLSELYGELVGISETELDLLINTRVLVHSATEIAFKRVKGDYTFHRVLDGFADRFLFMSSTILDPKAFCSDLGIDPNDMAYLDVESEFAADNRPVVFFPMMKMNASWNDYNRQQERDELIEGIQHILSNHKNESGIIHTANFKIAEFLVPLLQEHHQVIDHNPSGALDRDLAIKTYIEQSSHTPTILISPSCTEGLDLKDDLGRFAIFTKVPYGNLVDQWIKRRMEMSNEWYQRQALISIIQGGGRIVRTPDDFGVVYIVDASWLALMRNTKQLIPNWWIDAYQVF